MLTLAQNILRLFHLFHANHFFFNALQVLELFCAPRGTTGQEHPWNLQAMVAQASLWVSSGADATHLCFEAHFQTLGRVMC